MALSGTNHNAGVYAVCGDCMDVSNNFRENHPEQTKKIEEFLKD
jgi:hypothetical protein